MIRNKQDDKDRQRNNLFNPQHPQAKFGGILKFSQKELMGENGISISFNLDLLIDFVGRQAYFIYKNLNLI